jgi:3-hydroxybutyryl-CoA dehydratase
VSRDASEKRPGLTVGDELRAPPRSMHRERMRWYVDGLFTARANDGKVHSEENIHTDDAYARSQGLPGIIADGMISTNWIYGFLLDQFGNAYLHKGSLRTKYIKPILENQAIIAGLRVRAIERTGNECRYLLDVWCEDDTGQMLTVGSAEVLLPE